jgi:pyruvate,water dikinase
MLCFTLQDSEKIRFNLQFNFFMPHIIPFNSNEFPLNSGGKANKLQLLFRNGFNVPLGGVIPYSSYKLFLEKNSEIRRLIESLNGLNEDFLVSQIHQNFNTASLPLEIETQIFSFFEQLINEGFSAVAVRSSANIEDSSSSSFAGQFESYLNIRSKENLMQVVIKCWASQYGTKVLSYCRNNGFSPSEIQMSVIIQGQVDANTSGVVFTANPLTGNDKEMVIEAIAGLGEDLVQGIVNPETYTFNWYNGEFNTISTSEKYNSDSPLLAKQQIENIASTCLEVQKFFGEPLDIEWAIKNDRFFLLQARPLTSIHFDVEHEWTNADLKDGGVSSTITTPMMYSLYELIFEHTMPEYFRSIKIPHKDKNIKWFNWWFGYGYWNMQAAKECVKKIPGFNEHNFDLSLGIEPDYEGSGQTTAFTPITIIRGLRILFATKKSIAARSKKCKKIIETVKPLFSQIEETDFNSYSTNNLLLFTKELIEKYYLLLEGGYFFAIYDNSNAATFCQEAVDKYNKKHKNNSVNYLNLICGLKNLSHLLPTYDIWDLSRRIIADEKAKQFFNATTLEQLLQNYRQGSEIPFYSDIKLLIDKYKYHSLRELDILVSHWDEDPAQFFEALLKHIHNYSNESPRSSTNNQFDIFLKEKDKIKSQGLLRNVKMHRHLLWWREEMRDNSTKMYYYIRKCLLALADKLVAKGILKNRNDIFFLSYNEAFMLASNQSVEKYLNLIEKNKLFHQCNRNFSKPNEIWNKNGAKNLKKDKGNSKNELKGIASAPGICRAKARVILSVFEANTLCEGEILVTRFTDPGWTPYFAQIAGLVTETGGMLSHGAVVSREFGIPAVLGIKNATQLIKSNDTIEIDGHTGYVKILKD